MLGGEDRRFEVWAPPPALRRRWSRSADLVGPRLHQLSLVVGTPTCGAGPFRLSRDYTGSLWAWRIIASLRSALYRTSPRTWSAFSITLAPGQSPRLFPLPHSSGHDPVRPSRTVGRDPRAGSGDLGRKRPSFQPGSRSRNQRSDRRIALLSDSGSWSSLKSRQL
jgi:hypothetical protein